MDEPDLTSPYARLHRADSLVAELGASVMAWQDGCELYPISLDGYVYIIRAHFDTWPELHWATIIGDTVANLRGALDHAIYSLAVAESGADPPPFSDGLAFPNTRSVKAFDEAVNSTKRPKIGNLNQHKLLRQVILDHQEFGSHGSVLARLSRLDNVHKHRIIHVAKGSVVNGEVEAEWRNRGGTLQLEVGALTKSGPIATVRFDAPQQGEMIRAKFSFNLWLPDDHTDGLFESLAAMRRAVAETIAEMVDAVGFGHLNAP